MRGRDALGMACGALASNWQRTALISLATAIGVSAVLILTALGEGANRYVLGQFESLGTNLLIVLPGRSETVGGPPPLLGETPRDLTIDDAYALLSDSSIKRVAPVIVGSAPVSTVAGLEREVNIYGTTDALLGIQRLAMEKGTFLPRSDPHRGASVCVLGIELARELFADDAALGKLVRVGNTRFRVLGTLANSGVTVGVDFNDIAIIPVASAAALYNRESLFRILVETVSDADLDRAEQAIHRITASRHEGEDDVTVIAQDSVVKTVDRVLTTITIGVAAISAISLAVAGVLIMNVMLVSVAQRRTEIGLLKALGARIRDVRRLFLIEALMLAGIGAIVGLTVGLSAASAIAIIYPEFPIAVPAWSIALASTVAIVCGAVFGLMPANRAARLDPIKALSDN